MSFCTFAAFFNDSVAQPVEQMTLNHRVESSSLSGVTQGGEKEVVLFPRFLFLSIASEKELVSAITEFNHWFEKCLFS
jgi:hypothetical protein